MADSRFWYSVVEDGSEYRYQASCRWADAEDRAEVAADDYHSNHDGWESKWPLTFAIYDAEDGPEVARLSVELEFDPTFRARHISGDAEVPHV